MSLIAPVLAVDAETFNLAPVGSFQRVGEFKISNMVSTLFSVILVVVGIVFLFVLIMGGLKWLMSEGDDKKLTVARNQVTNALVGLAIVFSAWAVVALINSIFKINLLQFSIPQMQ
jgi:hypothetical protein